MKLRTKDGLELEGEVGEIMEVLGRLTTEVKINEPPEVAQPTPEKQSKIHMKPKSPIPYQEIFGTSGIKYMDGLLKSGMEQTDAIEHMAMKMNSHVNLPLYKLRKRCRELISWLNTNRKPPQKNLVGKKFILWNQILGTDLRHAIKELEAKGITDEKIIEYIATKAKQHLKISDKKLRKKIKTSLYTWRCDKKKAFPENIIKEPENLISTDDKELGFHVTEDKR